MTIICGIFVTGSVLLSVAHEEIAANVAPVDTLSAAPCSSKENEPVLEAEAEIGTGSVCKC